jgi:hypothetical protein
MVAFFCGLPKMDLRSTHAATVLACIEHGLITGEAVVFVAVDNNK